MTANVEIDKALSKEELEFIQNKLSSKFWRLNNLYKIYDKNGKLITLKLNEAQRTVLESSNHPKKIICKSRQHGITTLEVAYNLDSCLFKSGYSAGIQSYGNDEAKKLQKKAQLMWNNLDPNIKKLLGLEIIADNQHGMMFNNGSILKIGNFRGDTLQSLHVSELAKIAKKYPEKAYELKTGAFQAVSKDSKITIESTAEGKQGLFYEMWTKAVTKQKIIKETGGKLSPFDFEPIFLGWTIDNDCRLEQEYPISQELEEYFRTVEEQGVQLDMEQKWWYAAKHAELGNDIKQEYPTFPEEAFLQPVEGTYYEQEFKTLKIAKLEMWPQLAVHMACDLGMNDTFSIGFFQISPNGNIQILDEYMDNGLLLDDYKDRCDAMAKKYGWTLGYILCPHDIMVRELGSGQRIEKMKQLGFRPIHVRRHALMDGIQITREFLKKVVINESCENIITAIQNYRKKYDAKYQVFLDSPVHDNFSHTADMLRYMAVGIKRFLPNRHYAMDFVKGVTRQYYNVGVDI